MAANWGPYVSERAWGTVREDYSEYGTAWDSSLTIWRAPRLIVGARWPGGYLRPLSDPDFALALWNGRDPILKERLYGLVPGEANHGEDVKDITSISIRLPLTRT